MDGKRRIKVVAWLLLAAMAASLGLVSACGGGDANTEGSMDVNGVYYPGSAWRTSTPEEQGIDSARLVQMFETIKSSKAPIHSFLLIRHGYLVAEAYFHPFARDTRNDLFSATKSFTSTLIGIAIDEGKLKGVDQKVLDILPGVQVPDDKYGTSAMTIENILTMSAGHAGDSADAVYGSMDWARDFFSLPFAAEPGSKFLYDSGASHLLSAVLRKATGMNADAYAKKHIFQPLGISDYSWETTAEGLNTGGWGLRMTPSDMAKFGYLALLKGVWKDKQLVPSQWLEQACCKHIGGMWGQTPGDDYGYQWWMNTFGGFRADGFAGQYIYILPEFDIVAVVTSGCNYTEEYQPGRLMSDFVVPAAQSAVALPANASANGRLQEILKELASPAPQAVPSLPETASRISGKLYSISGPFGSFTLDFSKKDACTLSLSQSGRDYRLPVGLDGVYRVTEATNVGTLPWYPPYTAVALRGRWQGEGTFLLDWHYVGEPYREDYVFAFNGDNVTLNVTEYVVGSAGPMTPAATYNGKMEK